MARSIHCPECRNEITIRALRPGRFRSKCPKCSATFALTVPEGEDARPTVESLGPSPDLPVRPTLPEALPVADLFSPAETIPAEAPPIPPGSIEPPFQPPRSVGGYRVGRRLGAIRAGGLFEASRKATGRSLALALVNPRWSAEATFAARFAREAFAAGLLKHPNLIPPVDLGVDRGVVFAASDSLDGEALSDPRSREGLDRSARVATILHAARALRHAHEQGIYHRDLSTSQIRVGPSGLVRLAGVGVGLTPEVSEGAANLAREDLVALGRALQSLLGGSQGDRALTPGLAGVVRRMLGEGSEAAFPDLGAVVRALEAELGVDASFLPRDEEASAFEGCVRAFENVPLASLRPRLALGAMVVLGLFVALTLRNGRPLVALGALAFAGIVAATTVCIKGYRGRHPLYDQARELILGGTRGDLLTTGASLALLVAALFATGLLGFWIFLAILAAGLATARYYALDRPVEQARAVPIANAIVLIWGFRRLGIDEDSIRRFACRQGGDRWEEFFEALFGYEALRAARTRWGLDAGGQRRARFARWRDPIVDAIGARLGARREARYLAVFQVLEERALEARGINLLTARRKSRRISEAIVTFGRHSRRADHDPAGVPLREALDRVALRPDDYLVTAEADEPAGPPLWREVLGATARVLFGGRTRFLVGGACLAGCLLWMHQNTIMPSDEIKQASLEATADREKTVANAEAIGRKIAAGVQGVADGSTETRSLELVGLSPKLAGRLDGFGLGVAGLILVISAGSGGLRSATFAIPGAVIASIGPRLIEAGARPLGTTSLICLAVGAGLFVVGLAIERVRP